jgi:acetoin utilization protein AcuB
MKRIVDAITEEKIRFGSVLVARGWEKGKRAFFPYLFTHNTMRIKKKLEGSGFTLINPLELYQEPLPPE